MCECVQKKRDVVTLQVGRTETRKFQKRPSLYRFIINNCRKAQDASRAPKMVKLGNYGGQSRYSENKQGFEQEEEGCHWNKGKKGKQ